jgi:LPS sulfotransferase NodH
MKAHAPRGEPGTALAGKFLIVAHQRSGSSSLVRYLRLCTGERGVMEPFREKYAKKHGIDISTPAKLGLFMDRYYARCRFAKHLYNALDSRRNFAVYGHPSVTRIIFLYRKDLCASLLSSEIAKASGHWREIDVTRVPQTTLDTRQFSRNLLALRDMIENNFRLVMKAARVNGSRVLCIAYEDLYSTDQEEQRVTTGKILQFIGRDSGEWNAQGAFDRLISHENKYAQNKNAVIANHTELRSRFRGIQPELGWSLRRRMVRFFSSNMDGHARGR